MYPPRGIPATYREGRFGYPPGVWAPGYNYARGVGACAGCGVGNVLAPGMPNYNYMRGVGGVMEDVGGMWKGLLAGVVVGGVVGKAMGAPDMKLGAASYAAGVAAFMLATKLLGGSAAAATVSADGMAEGV